jgi:hypothetical protein
VERDDDMMYKECERNKKMEGGDQRHGTNKGMAFPIVYDRSCAGTSVHSTFHYGVHPGNFTFHFLWQKFIDYSIIKGINCIHQQNKETKNCCILSFG